jgi:HEAT repeat protein
MSLYLLARDGETDRLLDRLSQAESPAVRRRAAELLGEVATPDQPEVVDALIRRVTTDDEGAVRGAAIDALDQLGQDAIERLLAELTGADRGEDAADWAAAQRFVKALSASRPELRMAAANALGRIGEESVVPKLLEALDDEDPRVRIRLCTACGRIGHPVAIDPLEDRLDHDPHPMVRRAAADALGAIGTDEALAALLDLLEDESDSLRRVAATALGNASSTRPVAPLTATLGDPHGAVRQAAVFSLIELLSNVPTERSDAVRQTLVDELRAADDETVVTPLTEILDESVQARQRRNAAWLLGRVADDPPSAAIDALVDTLRSDDQLAANFAQTSLAEIGGLRVESSVLPVLDDGAAEARARAAFVLGQVGGDRSRDRLDRLTDEDDDKMVRQRAFAALSKLGGMR